MQREVEGVHRLGSFGYQTGPSEPQVTTRGRATCTKWLMSHHTSGEVTMCNRAPRHMLLITQIGHTLRNAATRQASRHGFNTKQRGEDTPSHSPALRPQVSRCMQHSEA